MGVLLVGFSCMVLYMVVLDLSVRNWCRCVFCIATILLNVVPQEAAACVRLVLRGSQFEMILLHVLFRKPFFAFA